MYGNLDKTFKLPKEIKSMLIGTDAPSAQWKLFAQAHADQEKHRRTMGKKRDPVVSTGSDTTTG